MSIAPDEPLTKVEAEQEQVRARALEQAALAHESSACRDVLPPLADLDDESRAEITRRLAALRELRQAIGPPGLLEPDAPLSVGAATARAEPQRLGRFTILRRLGQGGQGLVFLAHDPVLRRDVALKVPLPQILASEGSRERFLREAQILARLRHPYIVAVHDVGQVGEGCYLASEYCPGPNLAEWRRSDPGALDPRLAAELMAQIASGVAEAHRQGVVHRDLKPANVLLTPRVSADGDAPRQPAGLQHEPRITDFGLARFTDDAGRATQTGAPVGTAAYMAPEQAEGRRDAVGRPTDVYALGVMLYELLCGDLPHQGDSYPDTLRRIVYDEPRPLRRLRREIPRDLAAVCMKCLEKRPERRYADAGQLEADLRRFLRGEATEARALRWPQRVARWAQRRPALAALALVSLLSAATIVVGSVWYSTRLTQALALAEQEADRASAEAAYAERLLYGARLSAATDAFFDGRADKAAHLLAPFERTRRHAANYGLEWHLLQHLRQNQESVASHDAEVYALAVSPDGTLLATGAQDGSLVLTDAATHQRVANLTGHEACINELSFSSDGRRLVSVGCDGRFMLWDLASRAGRLIERSSQPIMVAKFSPSGRCLALAGAERGVQVFDTATWEATALGGEGLTPHFVAWHPQERYLAMGFEQHRVDVRSMPDGQLVTQLPYGSYDGAFSPAGDRLYITLNALVHVYETRDWSESAAVLAGHQLLKAIAIREDGHFAVGGDGTSIYSFASHLQSVGTPRAGHRGVVRDLAYSPDGETLYSVGCDGAVRQWPAAADPWPRRFPASAVNPRFYHCAPGSHELWDIDALGEACCWDLQTGRLLERRHLLRDAVAGSTIVSLDGSEPALVVLEPNAGLRRLDLAGRELSRRDLPGALHVFADSQGRLLAATGTGESWLVAADMTAAELLPASGLPFTQRNLLLADPIAPFLAFSDRQLTCFDLLRAQPLWQIQATIAPTAYSAKTGLVALGSSGPDVRLLRASDGEVVASLATDTGFLSPLLFNADGTRLVTGGAQALRIWDVESALELMAIPVPTPVTGLYFAPDESYLVASFIGGASRETAVWACSPPFGEARRYESAPRIRSMRRLLRSAEPRRRNKLEAKYELRTEGDASR